MRGVFLAACIIVSVGVHPASAQRMPQQARVLLDNRFPGWKLLQYRIPTDAQPGTAHIAKQARNVFRCNLNGDEVPDYAIAISTLADSIEQFIAIVSKENSYEIFELYSSARKYGGLQMLLKPANAFMAIFGDYEEELYRYGTFSPDSVQIKFPTDGVSLIPIIEKNIDHTFIFLHNRFVDISTAD